MADHGTNSHSGLRGFTAGAFIALFVFAIAKLLYNSATTGAMFYPPLHLDYRQGSNVMDCYEAGGPQDAPREARVAAIAAMLSESGGYNMANDGTGSDAPEEVVESLAHDHDRVVTDSGSAMGVLQWVYPERGSVPDLMNPSWVCEEFYKRYADTDSSGSAAERIADVQRNAFGPEVYEKNIDAAERVVSRISP